MGYLIIRILIVGSIVLGTISGTVFALDTVEKDFSSFGHWKITTEHSEPMGDRWCRAVGIVDGSAITILLGSLFEPYGSMAVSTRTFPAHSSLPAYKDSVQAADPRTCATKHAADAPAGSLRLGMEKQKPVTEICDGVHDWHALSESEAPANLLLDGAIVASGTIRGKGDQVDGKHIIYSAYTDFNHLEGIKEKFQHATKLEIKADKEDFPALVFDNMDLKRVMATLQQCLR